MQDYRIYVLTAERSIVAVKESGCANDDAALAQAADAIGPYAGAEVWQGIRLVGQVLPRG